MDEAAVLEEQRQEAVGPLDVAGDLGGLGGAEEVREKGGDGEGEVRRRIPGSRAKGGREGGGLQGKVGDLVEGGGHVRDLLGGEAVRAGAEKQVGVRGLAGGGGAELGGRGDGMGVEPVEQGAEAGHARRLELDEGRLALLRVGGAAGLQQRDPQLVGPGGAVRAQVAPRVVGRHQHDLVHAVERGLAGAALGFGGGEAVEDVGDVGRIADQLPDLVAAQLLRVRADRDLDGRGGRDVPHGLGGLGPAGVGAHVVHVEEQGEREEQEAAQAHQVHGGLGAGGRGGGSVGFFVGHGNGLAGFVMTVL